MTSASDDPDRPTGADHDPPAGIVHREIVALILLSAVAIAAFFTTRAIARTTHQMRLSDAAVWYSRGQQRARTGDAIQAAAAFRRASAIDRDNADYRLALAASLADAHDDEAATRVLMGLREITPEDAEVNLQLARLAARRGETSLAVRYYHSALYGFWGADAADAPRRVRIELIEYLLARGDRGRALSELLVLLPNLPDDAAAQLQAGQLLLDAGDGRLALEHFRRVLELDPRSPQGRLGAGLAAFELEDYASSQRYLRSAPRQSERGREVLAIVDAIAAGDPLLPRLRQSERRTRLAAALAHVATASDTCLQSSTAPPPAGNREQLAALRTEVQAFEERTTKGRIDEDALASGVNLTFRVEQALMARCGPGSTLDRALVRIARRHDLDRP